MSRYAIAASAALLVAALASTSASGFQSLQTFKNVGIAVQQAGATPASIANGFCTIRGFDNASAFDLGRYIQPAPGYAGRASFQSITCRSYQPVTSSGGLLGSP